MTEAEQLFEQVYRTYGPSLYRFCLIQMKNPADAEDILQEVFCKISSASAGFFIWIRQKRYRDGP